MSGRGDRSGPTACARCGFSSHSKLAEGLGECDPELGATTAELQASVPGVASTRIGYGSRRVAFEIERRTGRGSSDRDDVDDLVVAFRAQPGRYGSGPAFNWDYLHSLASLSRGDVADLVRSLHGWSERCRRRRDGVPGQADLARETEQAGAGPDRGPAGPADQVAALRRLVPDCDNCAGRPASCFGCCDGTYATLCDACCAHGNEDGWCVQLADLPGWAASVDATARELAHERDQLRDALEVVLESAGPGEAEHPTMSAAWAMAREVLRATRAEDAGRAEPEV